jgi:hypothetical protein
MKSELLASIIAVVLSIPAWAAAQASVEQQLTAATPVAPPAPALPMLGNTPYVAFGIAEPNGWAALDPNAPVTRVVTVPPPAASTEDDEVETANSPPMEMSAYALVLAGLAVLLYIGNRLRRD